MFFVKPEDLAHHKDDEPELEEDVDAEFHRSTGANHPLNVVILICGSRGDVQPFIAFGKGLQKRGHRVRLASHVTFRNFVIENGLEFYPLKGDPELLMNFMVNHPDMITLDPKEISQKKRQMELIYNSTWDACTANNFRAEVVISNPPVNVHVHLMQRLQVPLYIMFTMPWAPTKDYMHPLAPMQNLLDNKTSYTVVDKMIWVGLGSLQNEFRKKIGLNTIGSRGAYLVRHLKVPQIYCMSPHLAPKPTDWGSHIDVVGFWYLDLKSNFNPPKDLVEFFAAGPPPVYVGFGSIVVDDPKTLSKNVIEAIIQSKQRAVVSPGWAKLGEGMDLPPSIKLIGAVPHDWLLPQCAAACHHGGAGTTAAGLKSGCPTIIVPFFGDQPFWGSCVARMGVGPTPIPYKQLTAAKLRDAILFCVQPDVQKRAKEFGEKLRAEDGVATAVEAFQARLPVYEGLWVEEIHENQRKGITGWGAGALMPHDREPFTEKSGLLAMDISRFVCPPGWEWVGDWEPVIDPAKTDKQGWRYNKSFTLGSKDFHPAEGALDFVRTRKMIRRRRYLGDTGATLKMKALQIGHGHRGVDDAIVSKEGKKYSFHDSHKSNLPNVLLYVDVIGGRNIPSKDLVGLSDPFCITHLAGSDPQTQQTETIDNTKEPVWKEVHWFNVNTEDRLIIDCFDEDPVGQDFIGSFSIDVGEVLSGKIKLKDPQWYPLRDKGKPAGEIQLAFSYDR